MLERAELKLPLILLSGLSLLAALATITALILSLVWKYVGFMMSATGSSNMCTNYLTVKLQTNFIFHFNAIFIGGCISTLIQLAIILHLVYLGIKFVKSNDKTFQEFSEATFMRLYLGYSLSLLAICISVGYYGCYIIEYGWKCLNYILSNWLILGSLFTAAFVFLLVCWIYLLYLWITKSSKFDEVIEQIIQKSSGVEQPTDMVALFSAIKQIIKNQNFPQNSNEIKELLIEESIGQDEHFSIKSDGKEKLELLSFAEYKKKQEEKALKQSFENDLMMRLLIQQEERRIREQLERLQAKPQTDTTQKPNAETVPLSPHDPEFNNVFRDPEPENQTKIDQSIQNKQPNQEEYFPANFVPSNEQEKTQFQKYKKKLLKRHTINSIAQNDLRLVTILGDKSLLNRHPQNIEGGRNMKQVAKYCKRNKKPVRDESIYVRNKFRQVQIQLVSRPHQQQLEDKEDFVQKVAEFHQIKLEPVPYQVQQPSKDTNDQQQLSIPKEQQPQVLYFHKSKTKSQSRKKLFQQEQTFLSKNLYKSILGVLIKGVEETNMKNKLKQLRLKKNEENAQTKNKRSQRLIESIRAKFI